ncbi:MAG TPA: hypothetical protein VKH15_16380 [Candidatus Acidoferrum sp.]|nr:hypothetical protein [Candidatus Acidoferrum sp.]
MPYEISFTKKIAVEKTDIYFNECCWGGDSVRDVLLPLIAGKYEDVETNQEDWGWFIWFRKGGERLGIDICCDDPSTGEFRIRLSSRTRKFLWFYRDDVDTPELETIRVIVCAKIQEWAGGCKVEQIER